MICIGTESELFGVPRNDVGSSHMKSISFVVYFYFALFLSSNNFWLFFSSLVISAGSVTIGHYRLALPCYLAMKFLSKFKNCYCYSFTDFNFCSRFVRQIWSQVRYSISVIDLLIIWINFKILFPVVFIDQHSNRNRNRNRKRRQRQRRRLQKNLMKWLILFCFFVEIIDLKQFVLCRLSKNRINWLPQW
jgi:hypothetical protein